MNEHSWHYERAHGMSQALREMEPDYRPCIRCGGDAEVVIQHEIDEDGPHGWVEYRHTCDKCGDGPLCECCANEAGRCLTCLPRP